MFERRYICQTLFFGIYVKYRGGITDLDFQNDVKDTRLEYLWQNDDFDDRMKKLPYMEVVIYTVHITLR